MKTVSKVLIVGATGFLGQNAAEQLLSNGVVGVRATGRDRGVGQVLMTQGAEFVPLDLTRASEAEIQALVKGCDAIWYCAGTSPEGNVSPDEHEKVNFIAVKELFKAARESTTVRRFIYVSSSNLYIAGGHQHEIKEDFRAPLVGDEFVRSKLMAESYLRTVGYGATNIRTTILRPGVVYGPYERNWLPSIVDSVRREGKLVIPAGGGSVRDFTYVGNLVYAMYLATLSPVSRNEAVNVTDLQPMNVTRFFGKLFEHAGLKCKLAFRPVGWLEMTTSFDATRGIRNPVLNKVNLSWWVNDFTLDMNQAEDVLGYLEPLVPADEALEITGAWLRGQLN